ncbi:MAG: 1,4-alpha-glucan branching protein GlgB [Fusobacteriota bacterium]
MAVIRKDELNSILNANTKDPFHFLGLRKTENGKSIIRVCHPGAKKVEIISDELDGYREITKIHKDGFFEEQLDEDISKYTLRYTNFFGDTWESKDPYSFLPVLTDYDIHLFSEGNHHRIYEKMGAHIIEHEGITGVHFSIWAPNAQRVSVIGDFNAWDGRVHQMRMLGSSGIWEIFIPGIKEGDKYRFEIKSVQGNILLKSDPYAFYSEVRPANASIVYDINEKHEWNDKLWMKNRSQTNWLEEPISTYEVHLGSWARKAGNEFLTYKEMADKLVKYVSDNNYTHIELMPVAEHPLDESWGYQVTGFFSVNSRFGKPEELMYLIDEFHKHNIGVIMDWVPGHFPKDPHGLGRLDGSGVYEHVDPKQGEHPDWGTYIFNYGRNEVTNFLITNALYWLDKFHIDGLRVDAVASMLYLDYSKEEGQWVPNKHGGRENLEAIEFLQYFNSISHKYYPGILTIAEESTSFSGVSQPTYLGGLGFSMKWNMGWMNDSLEYIKKDPIYRKYHQGSLTFSLIYAFSENFKLVISHDEVVHGKGSMLDKMPGDNWQKFANLRLFYSYMYAHPGKKLLFMGGEFGQWKEWTCKNSLDWHLLEYEPHRKLLDFTRDLNGLYKNEEALYEVDFDGKGFEWIDFTDSDNSIISFIRKSKDESEIIVCVFNFTPMTHENYRIGVNKPGFYEEIFNSDSQRYWGSNFGNYGGLWSEDLPWQGKQHSLKINIPPLSGVYFKLK